MVECIHRQLKAAIKCHNSSNWVGLPIVLLGIRTAIKEDLNATAAEMIYGSDIRLPAEFFVPAKQPANTEFANRLRERMNDIRPLPTWRHGEKKIFMFRNLGTSPYVFVRHDAIGGSTTTTVRRFLSGYTAWGENFYHTNEGQKRESLRRSPKTRLHRFGRYQTTWKERRNPRHVFTWENLTAGKQRASVTKRGRRKKLLHHAFEQESSLSWPLSSGFELSG